MIAARFSDKIPQSRHGLVGAFSRPASVRVMNKMPLSGLLDLADQYMMNYAGLEVGREYFPDGRVAYNKTNGTARIISTAPQFPLQLYQIILPGPFKIQGIRRMPLIFPALQVSVVNIVEVEG